VILANLAWHLIEKPIMEMRRRMPKPSFPEIAPEVVAVVVAE